MSTSEDSRSPPRAATEDRRAESARRTPRATESQTAPAGAPGERFAGGASGGVAQTTRVETPRGRRAPPASEDEGATLPYLPRPATGGTRGTDSAGAAPPPGRAGCGGAADSHPPLEDAAALEETSLAETEHWAWTLEAALGAQQEEGEESHVIGGRYRILEGVAMGGMGAVFRVRHLTLDKVFALKIVHQALSDDSQVLKFFTREARLLSRLNHPGIVQIIDFGHDDRFGAYLVMEYLKGETLQARIDRQSRLSLGFALNVALQVAEALEYMHRAEIVHCDIKPENIFLVRQPEGGRKRVHAKIIDFGLSKSVAAGARLAKSEIGGTPVYIAPEQLNAMAPQPSMDIYAVGELLYHMLSGAPPFVGSAMEICSQKLSRDPEPLSQVLAEPIDEHLERLIMRAIARAPEARQASMGELIYELRTVMDMLGVGAARRRPTTHLTPSESPEDLVVPGQICDVCPVPAFFTDGQGALRLVNGAMSRLLHEAPGDLVGRGLGETRLGNVFGGAADAVRIALQTGRSSQHVVTVDRGPDHAPARLLVWLVPYPESQDPQRQLWGMVAPLEEGLLP